MTIRLRIPRFLCERMRTDLVRPHAFAAERIGFARAVTGTISDGSLVLLKSYWPVPDDQYIDDRYVGARINATAIRIAMQDILSGGGCHGLFHVHMHPRKGRTGMSKTDLAEIPKLIQSFRNVGLKAAHGLLILTPDHAFSLALLPDNDRLVQAGKITVVGYPTEILI
jgi:hypothetical protein